MNWPQLLFGFKGRITRLYWWVTSLVASVVAGMLTQSLEFWAQDMGAGALDTETGVFEPSGSFAIGVGVIALFNMWINFAVSAKRLHDRDRTGWWLLAPTLIILAAIVVGAATWTSAAEFRDSPWFMVFVAMILASIGMALWLLVELGFLRGTHGPNRFGPDPALEVQASTKT